MAYRKPQQESTIKDITVEWVSEERRNKKNEPFISVKSGKDIFWYVSDVRLFSHFIKGKTVKCLVQNGEFKKIIDVVDESFEKAHNELPPQVPAGKKEKEDEYLWEKAMVERLDRIGKLCAETNEMVKETILAAALAAEREEELPPLEDKTDFPPKEKPY